MIGFSFLFEKFGARFNMVLFLILEFLKKIVAEIKYQIVYYALGSTAQLEDFIYAKDNRVGEYSCIISSNLNGVDELLDQHETFTKLMLCSSSLKDLTVDVSCFISIFQISLTRLDKLLWSLVDLEE